MKRIFIILVLCISILCPVLLFAQRPQHPNLLDGPKYNNNFSYSTSLNPPYVTSDYERIGSSTGYNGVGTSLGVAGRLVMGSQATSYNPHFFSCIGYGATSSSSNEEKRFLIVNGFGATTNNQYSTGTPSSKKIIQYTVNEGVERYVMYDLSFYATHLCNGTLAGIPLLQARVNFRIQCNGSNVMTTDGNLNWTPDLSSGQASWDPSDTFRMNSGNNTTLVIAFYDDCEWHTDLGDDFGIDDVTLRLAPEYNVTAQSFTAPMACLSCEYSTITLQWQFQHHFAFWRAYHATHLYRCP